MRLRVAYSRLLGALCSVVLTFGIASAAQAQDVTPPKAYTLTPGGINVSDGSLVYSETDLAMGPLRLDRYLRSGARQPNDGMFGRNFSSNFDIYVARTSGTNASNIVHIGNSASGSYATTANSGIYADLDLDGQKGQLATNGSQYIYTDDSGIVYTFSATIAVSGTPFTGTSRRVERIDFPDGRRQNFSYTAGGKPRFVEDTSGYAILFDYDGNGYVSSACIFKTAETYVGTGSSCASSPASNKVSYGYTSTYVPASGTYLYYLTSVADNLSQTTTLANNGTVTCVTPPGFAACKMTYSGGALAPGSFNFYVTQTLADQGTWTVSGSLQEVGDGQVLCANGNMEAGASSPNGQGSISATFTNSSPYTMQDQLGRTTSFVFEGGVPYFPPVGTCNPSSYGSMLREATYPEGDKYQAVYNGPFKHVTSESHVAKPGSGLATLTKTYSYGSCTYPGTFQSCVKPIMIQDPAGNQTTFTYASHGGVLTEMAPAPSAGAARPLKVTTWTQRYAWTKNSGGTLVQGSLPIWVKATDTQCQTAAGSSPSPTCDTSAQQMTTTYEYGANGTGQSLLVKGIAVTADNTTLRTCYGYDTSDQRISETKPNAGLTTCP